MRVAPYLTFLLLTSVITSYAIKLPPLLLLPDESTSAELLTDRYKQFVNKEFKKRIPKRIVNDIHQFALLIDNPKTIKYLNSIEFTVNGQPVRPKEEILIFVSKNKPIIDLRITIRGVASLIGNTATRFFKLLDFLPIHINYDCFVPTSDPREEISLTEMVHPQLLDLFSKGNFSFDTVFSFAKKYFDWSNLGLSVKLKLPKLEGMSAEEDSMQSKEYNEVCEYTSSSDMEHELYQGKRTAISNFPTLDYYS